ncbi:MAG: TonB-dependent siderophore receptor, partial [Herminiimonas sp.]|nr:TonB-dependent siderophore receptor [Herminiimonas sp.]
MKTPSTRHILIACAVAEMSVIATAAIAQNADKVLQEVVITSTRQDGARAGTASVGGFSEAPLLETPASITVFTRRQMQDLNIRQTSDAMKFDASVNDSYNAIGYAEQFSIRGFTLDNSSSYRKDGLPIPADAPVPLENKERIEVLKGLAGLQAGQAAPGGILNFVTKRPTNTPLRSVTVEASERGTLYGAADLGGRFDDARFGYRINAAAQQLRSYVRGADGNRQFVSGAFDWRIAPEALVQLDFDYQRRSQLSVPGFQLFNGTDLPTGIDARTMLNNQPWSKPVTSRSSNIGLRVEYQLNADWRASLALNRHAFKRDDYAAFPYGCASANLFPGFCANGDFDVYDFQSTNESKSPLASQALIQGTLVTGALQHAVT